MSILSARKNQKEIIKLVKKVKQEGLTLGVISGSFDVLVGRHLASFEQAKKHCDFLLVLLNSDASIRLYKGKSKPINTETERAYFLSHIKVIDQVVIFDDLTPVRLIEMIQPDIYFNASNWGPDCIESVAVRQYGGKIKIINPSLPDTWNASTSALIKKIMLSESIKAVRAVFLDRDGVINENGEGYIHTWEKYKILPGVIASLKKLQKAGFKLFIITNQSGVGRGYYSETAVKKLHGKLQRHLEEHGIVLSGIYYCPHDPSAQCDCRKPSPGMLIQAANDHNLNLSQSWFIGDSGTDIDAGRQANVSTILINQSKASSYNGMYKPTATIATITEATKVILNSK